MRGTDANPRKKARDHARGPLPPGPALRASRANGWRTRRRVCSLTRLIRARPVAALRERDPTRRWEWSAARGRRHYAAKAKDGASDTRCSGAWPSFSHAVDHRAVHPRSARLHLHPVGLPSLSADRDACLQRPWAGAPPPLAVRIETAGDRLGRLTASQRRRNPPHTRNWQGIPKGCRAHY